MAAIVVIVLTLALANRNAKVPGESLDRAETSTTLRPNSPRTRYSIAVTGAIGGGGAAERLVRAGLRNDGDRPRCSQRGSSRNTARFATENRRRPNA